MNREASQAEIASNRMRQAYRNKMRLVHPDKINQLQPDADDKFIIKAKRLSEVLHCGNHILQNPELKVEYDLWEVESAVPLKLLYCQRGRLSSSTWQCAFDYLDWGFILSLSKLKF